MKTNEVLEFRKGTDTRTGDDLIIYSIKSKLSKADYIKLNQTLKGHECYYSRFAKGFICKTELPDEIELSTKTNTKPSRSGNVKYEKNLLDYITMEEYKNFLTQYAKDNYRNSWHYRVGSYVSIENAIDIYEKELLENLNHSMKYDSFGDLGSIREAIIHKSLGLSKDDFRESRLYYLAIWDKLPIIEGLEETKEAYTAMWGYDQTNVDIAFKLNKKVWGLDAFRQIDNEYYLVRMKNDAILVKIQGHTRLSSKTQAKPDTLDN